jgi:phosphatidylethanolamine-binding protein (PEBP) family uncharacterized protein
MTFAQSGGPCPPRGTHRCSFKLSALDKALDRNPGMTRTDLLQAMEGHLLAHGQVPGKHNR